MGEIARRARYGWRVEYREHPPPPEFAAWLECAWEPCDGGDAPVRVVRHGCVDIVSRVPAEGSPARGILGALAVTIGEFLARRARNSPNAAGRGLPWRLLVRCERQRDAIRDRSARHARRTQGCGATVAGARTTAFLFGLDTHPAGLRLRPGAAPPLIGCDGDARVAVHGA
jgi:hypothetical protein